MKKILVTLILLVTFTVILNAQSEDRWRLMVNSKTVAKGLANSPGQATISKSAKGKLYVKFWGAGATNWHRSILIFDTQRHQLLKQELKKGSGKFAFFLDSIKSKTQGQQFEIYTVAVPSNPEEAASIRVRPVLLCTVSWKQ